MTMDRPTALVVLCGLLVTALPACEPTPHAPGQPMSAAPPPSEATVTSLRVFPGELREGLRKVEVIVTVAASAEHPERSMTIVEWVPVVLLRRVAVTAKVGLTPDPLDQGRMTLAL
jgi:hypothetical protein